MDYLGHTVEGATHEMILRYMKGENLSFADQQRIFDRHHHVNDGDGIGYEDDNYNPAEPFDYSSLPESAFDKSVNVVETDDDPLPAADAIAESEVEEYAPDAESGDVPMGRVDIDEKDNREYIRYKLEQLAGRQYIEKQGKPDKRGMKPRPHKQAYNSRPFYEEVGNGYPAITEKRELSSKNGGVRTNYGGTRGYDRNSESRMIETVIDEGFDAYNNVDYSIDDETDRQETPVVRKDKEYYFNLFQKHKWDTHVDLDTEFEERNRIIGLYLRLRRGTIDTVSLRDLKSWYRHFETTPDFEEDLDDTLDTFDDFDDDYEDIAPIEVEDAAKQKGAIVEYFSINADGESYTVGIIEKKGGLKKRREIVVKKLVYAREVRKGQVDDLSTPNLQRSDYYARR